MSGLDAELLSGRISHGTVAAGAVAAHRSPTELPGRTEQEQYIYRAWASGSHSAVVTAAVDIHLSGTWLTGWVQTNPKMANDKQNLLLFFDRPSEPIFMQKGTEKATFQLPDNYYPDKYKDLAPALSERFGEGTGKIIPIRNISIPDISLPLQLGKQEQFSLFVQKHRRMAGKLIDIFLGMRNVEDLMSICSYCQPRVNPYMMNYCLSVAILNRPDTKGLAIPTFVESFPDKFMDPKVFKQARETASVLKDTQDVGSRSPIIIPRDYTASTLEPEQTVAYFREDLGINLHHWHWHLVYPFESANREVVNKDRRGELFFYMHQQIIARYDFERICNGMQRVRPYENFREPINEAYFPKMDSIVASRAWPPRFANTRISDLKRAVDQIDIDVTTLETWRDRFLDAVNKGRIILPNNREQALDEMTGIDVLGNMMEASIISRNPGYYGDLHNMGHVFISYSHDPDHRHLEQFGVMGDSATAMRDPVFYRWHKNVDNIFQIHKRSLPVYETNRLDFPGIQVAGISVQTAGGQPNTINTMWQQSTVDLSRGMDFVPRGAVLARFTHLQHRTFEFVIQANNTTGAATSGTVRIFMAPRNDANGQPFRSFNDLRIMMIELDKFTQNLRPGNNTIRRRSSESSVTIPFERTFRDLDTARPADGSTEAAAFDFCGCGWPSHMLIPKGSTSGTPVDLFCMISNGADDRVEQTVAGQCNDAESYCGVRDARYPDRRSMGYPFDRRGRSGVTNLQSFLTPNMAVSPCTILFTDSQ